MLNDIEPKKWKKYSLLSMLNLRDQSDLRKEIQRFRKSDVQAVSRYVASLLKSAKSNTLAVIKLVTLDDPGQLVNIRIQEVLDWQAIATKIETELTPSVVEVWVCSSTISRETGNFAGRWLYQIQHPSHEVIELIWWNSPRLLEGPLSNGLFPLARFERRSGQLSFRLTKAVPDKSHGVVTSVMQDSMKLVWELLIVNQEGIRLLTEAVSSCGLGVVSLEFKFQGWTGRIIDWDTSDDEKILRYFDPWNANSA